MPRWVVVGSFPFLLLTACLGGDEGSDSAAGDGAENVEPAPEGYGATCEADGDCAAGLVCVTFDAGEGKDEDGKMYGWADQRCSVECGSDAACPVTEGACASEHFACTDVSAFTGRFESACATGCG